MSHHMCTVANFPKKQEKGNIKGKWTPVLAEQESIMNNFTVYLYIYFTLNTKDLLKDKAATLSHSKITHTIILLFSTIRTESAHKHGGM